jgi:hypothetical protein
LGAWEIEATGQLPLTTVLGDNRFTESQDFNKRQFRDKTEALLEIHISRGYRVFASKLSLGEQSICPRMACSVAVIAAEADPRFYVLIWKTQRSVGCSFGVRLPRPL